jgi:NADPH:quinone reductase-like Zn-dependent oxidoreductase
MECFEKHDTERTRSMPRSWIIKPGHGPSSLTLEERPRQSVSPGQVRLSIHAASLNARDLMVALGQSPMPVADELVPVSDGAGVVEEVSEGVTRVAVGDRVVVTFNPAHQSGPFEPYMAAHALGELSDGLLAEEAVVDQMALVKVPDSLTLEQAACLPCVGVTAWNALFESGPLYLGQTVLATGTGTVSLAALALAKAAGVRVGVTSSDDAKLDRARALGADYVVNYRRHEAWDQAVRDATDGVGAHVILENAGPPSIATSVRAAAAGGRVVQIGWKGLEGPPIAVPALALGQVTIVPIMVGSRVMLERLVAAIAHNRIELPIHATYDFEAAPAAFEALTGGRAFGKIVITRKADPS